MIPTLPPPPPLESSYSLAYAWTVYRTFQTLLKLPYNMMRRANLVVRIQVGRLAAGTYGQGGIGVGGAGAGWCCDMAQGLPRRSSIC